MLGVSYARASCWLENTGSNQRKTRGIERDIRGKRENTTSSGVIYFYVSSNIKLSNPLLKL